MRDPKLRHAESEMTLNGAVRQTVRQMGHAGTRRPTVELETFARLTSLCQTNYVMSPLAGRDQELTSGMRTGLGSTFNILGGFCLGSGRYAAIG